MSDHSRVRGLLRGALVFLAALAIATAAFLALAFGYSLVVCHSGGEGAFGWALFMLLAAFLGEPVLAVPYAVGNAAVAMTLRAALARFGVARCLGGLALALIVLTGLGAAVTALAGPAGGCSMLI